MESGKISGRSKRIQNLSSRLNNELAAGKVINDDHNCNLATASNVRPVLEDQPAVLSVPVSDEMNKFRVLRPDFAKEGISSCSFSSPMSDLPWISTGGESQCAVLSSVPVSAEMNKPEVPCQETTTNRISSCPSNQLSAPVATGIDSNEPTP